MIEQQEPPVVTATANHRFTTFVAKHRIGVLLIITIGIAVTITSIGLSLYHADGTAQLDLTRPDYAGVGETIGQNGETSDLVDFPASGSIDEAALKEFDALYEAQLKDIESIDAFGGDPMSLESLRINNKQKN